MGTRGVGAGGVRSLPGALLLAAAALLGGCSAAVEPAAGPALSVTRLKYVLDEHYTIFFCDPDYYPIARGDELEAALLRFPAIAADTEKYAAIREHLGLPAQGTPADSAKLRVYREDKRLATIALAPAGDDYAFQLRAQESKGAVYALSGRITRAGDVREIERTASVGTCPICLSGETRIATPGGEVPVRSLRAGDTVWSPGPSGERLAVSILRVGHVPVPPGHFFVRLRLADGRSLLASPGHPTAGGRPLGALAVSDTVDGSRVTALERVPARDAFTWDLLPAGPTGVYWADGVRLQSTLAKGR